ncbi:murein L,D-transpeptidase catalytic domain family protein [Gillisia sp. M10.2A]|uniref:Murein L,D-transpeptidase catalytic domain family protein n=1 Tax=Gillisia lutea TaxID=2909668 RepID=A0ABS9EJ77_9FLAO|nr:murein L,D-transpeptidase catalytic domain family protein [Gillisia lutea]MCF4102397.1 murein L,D-transpeptidase catalytic domain family protein [Gillisia lutea]
MTHKILTVIAFLTGSIAFTTTEGHNISEITSTPEVEISKKLNTKLTLEEEITQLYDVFVEKNTNVPDLQSFKNGMIGYYKLSEENLVNKKILTIIDFSLSSTKKRMWVMDMTTNKVLYNTVVAHGKNTGGEFATKFSNKVNSLQSSLGFYVTGETYYGKNGLSMFIDGMEKEFNSKARERYVVVHGANYANPSFINKIGRLGRSYGCPAVPTALTAEIIDLIKDKSVLYIHSADKSYAENSKMIRV